MLALIALGYGFGTTAVAALISRRTGRELQGEALGLNQSVLALFGSAMDAPKGKPKEGFVWEKTKGIE